MTAPLTSIVTGLPASVPFVGPEALERARGRPSRARLGANESAFGAAPGAIAAMYAAATEGWEYAIAARHGVTAPDAELDVLAAELPAALAAADRPE